MRSRCLGLVLAALSVVAVAAIDRDLSDDALDDAIRFARQANPATREAFHRAYVFPNGSVPIASISLVTEYRRVVIAAEDRLLLGDRMWGLREAREVLRHTRNTIELIADVKFHPQNVYVTVPQYDIRIVRQGLPDMLPIGTQSTARYGVVSVSSPTDPPYYPFPPPSLPAGPGADPMLGAWVSATFSATSLDPRDLIVAVVREGPKDLARVAIDLSRLR